MKKAKKLVLSKETLHRLGGPQIKTVQGAYTMNTGCGSCGCTPSATDCTDCSVACPMPTRGVFYPGSFGCQYCV